MCQAAAELLLRKVEADGEVEPQQVQIESELAIRDSTRPLKCSGAA
jgi:DNA-binding LacI/PurR family transcriptional regulator